MAAGGLTMSGFGDVFITVFSDASHCPRTLATNEVCDKLAGQAMRRVRDEIDSGD